MEEFIQNNLSTYGPWAVFLLLMLSGFGIALGEEMVTLPAGVFIASGELGFWQTAACAYAGIVLADFLWFYLCRHYGTPMLHKPWFKRFIHPRRLLEVKHQFEKRGTWLIVMARFIPSSRTTAITVAGIVQMPFWKFAVATASCVLITVPMQLGLGYIVGRGIESQSTADRLLKVLGLVMLVVLVTVLIGWWSRHRASKRRPPRARAAWLRGFRRRSRRSRQGRAVKATVDGEPGASSKATPATLTAAEKKKAAC